MTHYEWKLEFEQGKLFTSHDVAQNRNKILWGITTSRADVFVLFGWMFYRYQSPDCKQRGKAYGMRVERLERDARTALRIGTHQEDVIRFFQENGLPVSFNKGMSEYEGTIRTKGCAPAGCGSDDAILGLRVKADSNGTVVGEPVVDAIYTNCL